MQHAIIIALMPTTPNYIKIELSFDLCHTYSFQFPPSTTNGFTRYLLKEIQNTIATNDAQTMRIQRVMRAKMPNTIKLISAHLIYCVQYPCKDLSYLFAAYTVFNLYILINTLFLTKLHHDFYLTKLRAHLGPSLRFAPGFPVWGLII
jgi:hypothetical protein